MDIPYGDERLKPFITNVGLITSNGSIGHNIMAAEWTHLVSYTPCLVAVCVSNNNQSTRINIKETQEFGVGIASVKQNVVASVAGNNKGNKVNKIEVLKELGVEFYEAAAIDTLMVKDTSINLECKVVQMFEDLGGHTIFIGEAQNATNTDVASIAYNWGTYHHLGEKIEKPEQAFLDKITGLIEKHTY